LDTAQLNAFFIGSLMLVKDSIGRSIAIWIVEVLVVLEVMEVLRGAFESGHIVNGLIACPFTHCWRHGGRQIPDSCWEQKPRAFFFSRPLCLRLYVAANPPCDGILGPLQLWLTAGACVLSFMHINPERRRHTAAFPYRLSTWSAERHKDITWQSDFTPHRCACFFEGQNSRVSLYPFN